MPLQEGPRSPDLADASSKMALLDGKKAKNDRRLERNGDFEDFEPPAGVSLLTTVFSQRASCGRKSIDP